MILNGHVISWLLVINFDLREWFKGATVIRCHPEQNIFQGYVLFFFKTLYIKECPLFK